MMCDMTDDICGTWRLQVKAQQAGLDIREREVGEGGKRVEEERAAALADRKAAAKMMAEARQAKGDAELVMEEAQQVGCLVDGAGWFHCRGGYQEPRACCMACCWAKCNT